MWGRKTTIIKNYTLACRTLDGFDKLHSKSLEGNNIDLKEYNKLKETYTTYKNTRNKLSSEFTFEANIFIKNNSSINFKWKSFFETFYIFLVDKRIMYTCLCFPGKLSRLLNNPFNKLNFDRYSPNSLATVDNNNSNILINLPREDAYACLQNIYIGLDFEILETDNIGHADND